MLFNIRFDHVGYGTEKHAFDCYEWLQGCYPVGRATDGGR
jgi:hypothetical protein